MGIIKDLIGFLQNVDQKFNVAREIGERTIADVMSRKNFPDEESFQSAKTALQIKLDALLDELAESDADLAARLKQTLNISSFKPVIPKIRIDDFVEAKIKSFAEAAAFFGAEKPEDVSLERIKIDESSNQVIFGISDKRKVVYHNHLLFLYIGGRLYHMQEGVFSNLYEALEYYFASIKISDWKEQLFVTVGNVDLRCNLNVWKYQNRFVTVNWGTCFSGEIINEEASGNELKGNLHFKFEAVKPQFFDRKAAAQFFSEKLGVEVDEIEIFLGVEQQILRWYYQNYFVTAIIGRAGFHWGVFDSRAVHEAMARKEPLSLITFGVPFDDKRFFEEDFRESDDGWDRLVVKVENANLCAKYLYRSTAGSEYYLYQVFARDASAEQVNKDMYDPEIWKQYLSKFSNQSKLNKSLA